MPQCWCPTCAHLEDFFFTHLLNGQSSQSAKHSISQLIEPEFEPPISLVPTNSRSLRLPATVAGLMQIEQEVNILIGWEANQSIWIIQAETMLKRIYTPDFLCCISRHPVESWMLEEVFKLQKLFLPSSLCLHPLASASISVSSLFPLYSVSTSAITKKLSLFPTQSLSLSHTHAQLLLIHVATSDICSTLWWCIFPTSAIRHCSTSSHSVPTTCSAVLLHCIVPRYTDRDRLRQING